MRGQDWLTKRWTGGDQEWGFEFRQNYLRFPVAWHARRNNKKAERPPLCPPGINWLKCVSNIQGYSSLNFDPEEVQAMLNSNILFRQNVCPHIYIEAN